MYMNNSFCHIVNTMTYIWTFCASTWDINRISRNSLHIMQYHNSRYIHNVWHRILYSRLLKFVFRRPSLGTGEGPQGSIYSASQGSLKLLWYLDCEVYMIMCVDYLWQIGFFTNKTDQSGVADIFLKKWW